ncbi:amidase family protein [Actinoplanes sp. NPDC049596]|uniref:amidase family protein n=1 Tax=unclassified Actinoplanes TaxID=2626549 RepID=UPI00343B4FD4
MPIAESVTMRHNGRSLDTFSTFTRYTFGVSMTGLPALSLPAGAGGNGLPVGVQLIGKPWDEARLIEVGPAIEQHRPRA